jgi:MATE family multidrug resistance protein
MITEQTTQGIIVNNRYPSLLKETLRLSYPIIVAQLGGIGMGIADTIMVGRIGAAELAAASLGSAIFFLLFCFGFGLTFVLSPLIAQAHTKKDYATLHNNFSAGIQASLVVGIIVMFALFLSVLSLPYLGQDAEVERLTFSYLISLAFGVIPFILFFTLRNFTDGISMTKVAMYITLVALLTNVFLNWVFIFGNLGVEKMGLLGAGIATTITRFLMFFAMVIYIQRNKITKNILKGFVWYKSSKKDRLKVYQLGLPAGLQYFFEIASFSIAAIMAGWLGKYELASHQIVINLASTTYLITMGFSMAGSILVAQGVSEKDFVKIKRVSIINLFLGTLFMVFASLCFIFFPNFWIRLYSDEPRLIEISLGLLFIACFFQVSDGLQCVGLGILRGFEDIKLPTLFTMIAYWGIGLPAAYVLGFTLSLGVDGIWYGLSLGLTFSALLLNIRFFYLLHFKKRQASLLEMQKV